ncbi:hypothetical protein V2J09_003844 [Rumex salicifolius]
MTDMGKMRYFLGIEVMQKEDGIFICQKKYATEEEYVSASTCACQAIWMRSIMKEIGHEQAKEMVLLCDNTSTIKLSKNLVMHERSKHIRVRYHFLRDLTKEGVIKLVYCRSEMQLADIMTKPLKLPSFQKIREELGMRKYELITSV